MFAYISLVFIWERSSIPSSGGEFRLFHCVQAGPLAHQTTYSVGTEVISTRMKRPGHEAAHFHVVPRLRMRGAVPLLPIIHVVVFK
jgi:hypothetical protein